LCCGAAVLRCCQKLSQYLYHNRLEKISLFENIFWRFRLLFAIFVTSSRLTSRSPSPKGIIMNTCTTGARHMSGNTTSGNSSGNTTSGNSSSNASTQMSGYQAGQTAAVADSALKTAIRQMEAAEHRAVLWFADIMNRRLYRMLGDSNMPQYAAAELNFSKTRSGDFMRLARKLEQLPAVKKSLATGDLGYTNALEIIKVATPNNEENWVAEAASVGRRELAEKVKRVRIKARRRRGRAAQAGQGSLLPQNPSEKELAAEVPVRVAMEMTPEQFARFEALLEKAHKLGAVPAGLDRVNTLLAGLDSLVQGTSNPATESNEKTSDESTRRRVFPPPFQIHVHRCPECGKSTVQTSRGEMEISTADAERAECDGRIKRPGQSNTATVPPARRTEVLERDRFRCRAPGCDNSRFLEVHHVKPKSRGGGNELENLITLCSGCHRLHHEGRLKI